MDGDTFGSSKAAEILADKLTSAKSRLRKKVTTTIITFNRGLNQLENISDMHIRMALAKTWFESYYATDFKVDPEITTYTRNVLKIQWRTWLKKQPTLEYIHARQRGDSGWRDVK